MRDKWIKLKSILFSKKFIRFCIIGVLNTIIHLIIYNLLREEYGGTFATTIAFITASVFSYFANSIFTYRTVVGKKTFLLSMFVFLIKLLVNNGLEFVFSYLFTSLSLDFMITFIPLFITAIILPLQFLVFNKIFKEPVHYAKEYVEEKHEEV